MGAVLAGWAFGVLVWSVGQSGGTAVGVEIFERVEAEELAAVVLGFVVAVAERVEL